VTRLERKVLEKESRLAVYYEACNILFPALSYSGFPFNPVDKSLLSDILRSCNSQVIDEDNT
jgi:hypothetical protein